MKIAMVYDATYPWVKGGGEKRIYELSKRLVVMGHEVHLFGVNWWSGSEIIEKDGIILHGVCDKMELYINGRRSISEAMIFSIKLLPSLAKERYDIIDVTSFPYFSCFTVKLISTFSCTPMLITWHEVWGDYWYEYMGKFGFFGKVIEYVASKLAKKSITVSEMTRTNLEKLGIKSENISTIFNGVNIEEINNISPSENKCDIIFVGRLIKEKNVNVLIKAIYLIRKNFPNIQCHIIGDGPEKKKLIDLAVEYGLIGVVRFLPFIEHNDVIARIKSSKMLILPSSREGFGMVVIEAFACGIPVITVREKRNAASDLVTNDTGLVVDLNAEEMSNAISILMNMEDDLRKTMSKYAKDKAQSYDWDDITEVLAKLYRDQYPNI